eukprot:CAMPEP_0197850074 /NCGR_PEP_ID=MMETSP1438-20131217/14148_1 /TAXON_ID=1461541 /ORGANISM="Pterosperma sp., Strain CCMP1384" /LENGTH=470 /DNA_ID=CAMNT_0043463035 /DNA_START=44 /DNA_END=1456 /DNA_ORIENTATION=-
MTKLSCLARDHEMVLVANMDDHQPCATRPDIPCPKTGHLNYNTQVAFSDQGEFLERYYKEHLFDENMNKGESHFHTYPLDQDPRWFDTHFGVRFGMHVCFDIMFRTPGAALAMDPNLNITDFVFSTHWETPGPPMLTATATQQGWSKAVGVNLIASDAGEGWHTGGSGIFSNGRILAQHYEPDMPASEALLIAQVPHITAPTPNIVTAAHSERIKATSDHMPSKESALEQVVGPRHGSLLDAVHIKDANSIPQSQQQQQQQQARFGWAPGQVAFFDMLSVIREMANTSAGSSGSAPSAARTSHQVQAHHKGFECVVNFELSLAQSRDAATSSPGDADADADVYALVAQADEWYGGVLPSRSCVFIRCPDGTPASCHNVANATEPYTPDTAFYSTPEDLRAFSQFKHFEMEGGFEEGDLVMAVLASDRGRLFNDRSYSVSGGKLVLDEDENAAAQPILNAMLIANTGEGPI